MCVSPASADPLLFLPAAVRTGNLAKFNQVLDQFGEKFQADGTYTLIIRLRHNVIKTGVHQEEQDPGTGATLWVSRAVKGLCSAHPATPFSPRGAHDQPLLLPNLPG